MRFHIVINCIKSNADAVDSFIETHVSLPRFICASNESQEIVSTALVAAPSANRNPVTFQLDLCEKTAKILSSNETRLAAQV